MWVGQFGGDIHLEVIVVGNDCVSQLQNRAALLLVGLGRERHIKQIWKFS